MEVRKRAVQPDVELFIRCHDEAIVSLGGMERSFHFDERILIRAITTNSPTDFTGDSQIPLDDFSSWQTRVEADLTGKDSGRSRRTTDGNPPVHRVQPLIPERYSILGYD